MSVRKSALETSPFPSGDLVDETIAIFQPTAIRTLTREDARMMLDNLTGFFSTLHEWKQQELLSPIKESV